MFLLQLTTVDKEQSMQKRNVRSPEFKKKVALAAIREDAPLNEIALKFGVHVMQVSKWKKELLDNAELVFEKKNKKESAEKKEAELHEQIGRLTVENNWIKKKLGL